MSFVKWDDCINCDGEGAIYVMDFEGELCPDQCKPSQCPVCAKVCLLHSQLAEKDKEIERLKAALEKYGNHTAQCGLQAPPEVCYRCTCGLGKALAEGEQSRDCDPDIGTGK